MFIKRELSLKQSKRGYGNFLRIIRYQYLLLLRLEASPKAIARGLACGVFAGCFPWFGLQTILGIFLAFLVRGNKIAAALGTWISNPFTYAPLFFFNFKIGQLILGDHSTNIEFKLSNNWSEVTQLGQKVLIDLFLGSFVVGLIACIIVYFLSLAFIRRRKKIEN
jgi:uncharacterized protein (DUF2062 family)